MRVIWLDAKEKVRQAVLDETSFLSTKVFKMVTKHHFVYYIYWIEVNLFAKKSLNLP